MNTAEALLFAVDPANEGVKLTCSTVCVEHEIRNGYIFALHTESEYNPISAHWHTINKSEWRISIEKVDFIEAVKAFRAGKVIYSSNGNENNFYYTPHRPHVKEVMKDQYGDPISSGEILDYDWYIKG